MRRAVLLPLTLLLLLAPLVAAQVPTSELYDAGSLTVDLTLTNTLTIVSDGPAPAVDFVSADLSWYPRDSYRQRTSSVRTSPEATKTGGGYRYLWLAPRDRQLTFSISSRIETTNQPLPVTSQERFPITKLPPEIALYTRPGELIDTDEAITQQALALAGDKEDLFEIVYTVADWVTTNIEYNLTSITTDATQRSTWVMENRQGVCDEMTALFISMLRSLGIPARFVSGVSYTNLPQFPRPWGGHGWAEVWFPRVGWVPFDVTYGTYGYIDATHLKLDDSFDAEKSSIEFLLRGSDVTLVTQGLDISADVVRTGGERTAPFHVTLAPFDDSVGAGSHNVITATVTNDANQYVSARLTLGRTEDLTIVGDAERNVLLKPRESKKVHYLVKVGELRAGYLYTFPVTLYAGFQEVGTAKFTVSHGFGQYDEDDFSEYLTVAAEQRGYNDKALLRCASDRPAAYLGEEVLLTCTLENRGASTLEGVTGCIAEDCRRFDAGGGTNTTFEASARCEQPGGANLFATAKSFRVSKTAIARFECLDEAEVEITDVTVPDQLGYNESGDITFTVDRASETIPEAVIVRVRHDNFKQEWSLAQLVEETKFTLRIPGHSLDTGDNPVWVEVDYQDRLGKEGTASVEEQLTHKPFTAGQKFNIFLQNIQRWLEGMIN